jgi:membrane-bound serine protease (ClpP class)
MAPQTNIGSSTPINVGGEDIAKDLRRKAVNDAAASLRALADRHGRNAAWADSAVRQASNITAREALRRNVIDVIAPTLPALLDQIDGRRTVPRNIVLRTAGAEITTAEMSLWKRILDTLVDPTIIQLLLSIGLLGIVVELWHPGLIFPGVVGGISLVIGLYGLQVLPVSWAGILLMVLAAGFWAAEPFVVSHGALAVAGGVCFVLGSLLLFDPAGPAYDVSIPVTVAIAAVITGFLLFAVAKVYALRRRPATTGAESMLGAHGIVRDGGLVAIRGELWRARSAADDHLPPGTRVVVDGVDRGLTLVVHAAPPAETPPT